MIILLFALASFMIVVFNRRDFHNNMSTVAVFTAVTSVILTTFCVGSCVFDIWINDNLEMYQWAIDHSTLIKLFTWHGIGVPL